jgi:hypothetical protein
MRIMHNEHGAHALEKLRQVGNSSSSAVGPNQLMRIPITESTPEVVLTARIYEGPVCTRFPAGFGLSLLHCFS